MNTLTDLLNRDIVSIVNDYITPESERMDEFIRFYTRFASINKYCCVYHFINCRFYWDCPRRDATLYLWELRTIEWADRELYWHTFVNAN